MFDTLLSSGQFVTFLSLLGVGLAYILVTGALGSLFGVHHDVPYDGHSAEHSDDTVSIFSPRIIAIFSMGLGAGGAIATYAGFGAVGATLWGIGSGAGLGGLGVYGLSLLYSQQSNSEVSTADAVGKTATVTLDIPLNQVGEVNVTVNGQVMTYRARANRYIPKGVSVSVQSASGGEVLVS